MDSKTPSNGGHCVPVNIPRTTGLRAAIESIMRPTDDVAKLEAAIEQLNLRLAKQEAAAFTLAAKQAESEREREALAERDKTIARLTKSLERREEEAELMREEMQELLEQNHRLKRVLAEREGEIAGLLSLVEEMKPVPSALPQAFANPTMEKPDNQRLKAESEKPPQNPLNDVELILRSAAGAPGAVGQGMDSATKQRMEYEIAVLTDKLSECQALLSSGDYALSAKILSHSILGEHSMPKKADNTTLARNRPSTCQ